MIVSPNSHMQECNCFPLKLVLTGRICLSGHSPSGLPSPSIQGGMEGRGGNVILRPPVQACRAPLGSMTLHTDVSTFLKSLG